jgi:CDP-glucose 4,6-dehydratase
MVMGAGAWSQRRVLVTGATGLVGAWLVKQLRERGSYVVALIRDSDPQSELFRSGDVARVSVISGDLADFFTVERAISEHEVDTVLHLAAQPIVGVAHRFPLQTFESNIRGTYHVLEACRIHRALVRRVVVASSDKAYGEQPQLPYTEDMPLHGRHPYEVSKSCADLLAQSYHHTFGLPIGIARCGNIYGGGDLNWSRIVPGTIRSLLRGERPIIRSDGKYVRDYIYVKDVAHAYLTLADGIDDPTLHGGAFNFSPESRVNVLELVDLITRLMDCRSLTPDVQNTAQGEIHSQYLSADKANRLLAWRPTHTLEAGLRETIAWYREFLR